MKTVVVSASSRLFRKGLPGLYENNGVRIAVFENMSWFDQDTDGQKTDPVDLFILPASPLLEGRQDVVQIPSTDVDENIFRLSKVVPKDKFPWNMYHRHRAQYALKDGYSDKPSLRVGLLFREKDVVLFATNYGRVEVVEDDREVVLGKVAEALGITADVENLDSHIAQFGRAKGLTWEILPFSFDDPDRVYPYTGPRHFSLWMDDDGPMARILIETAQEFIAYHVHQYLKRNEKPEPVKPVTQPLPTKKEKTPITPTARLVEFPTLEKKPWVITRYSGSVWDYSLPAKERILTAVSTANKRPKSELFDKASVKFNPVKAGDVQRSATLTFHDTKVKPMTITWEAFDAGQYLTSLMGEVKLYLPEGVKPTTSLILKLLNTTTGFLFTKADFSNLTAVAAGKTNILKFSEKSNFFKGELKVKIEVLN